VKFSWSVVVVVVAALLSACGGDGGSGDAAPSISNLSYTPTSELQLPGDSATITGTVDFADSGGNVVEMHLSTSAGDSLTLPLSLPGVDMGTLTGSFTVSLDQIGRTSFEVWLQDSAGQVSNRLGGTFDVFVNDTVPRWRSAPGQAELGRLLGTNGLNGVASDGKRYVFAGSNVIVTSTDLVSWDVQSVAFILNSIAWSGKAFVAVGSEWIRGGERDVLMHSADGASWSVMHMVDNCPAPLPGTTPPNCEYKAGLSKVIWAGSQFLAVGREAVPGVGTFALILTSPDGLSWTQQAKVAIPVGADVDVYGMGMASVAWSGSRFVAVGRATDGSAALWTSPDALSWSAGTLPGLPAAPQFTLRDVVWGHGQFVAAGWGGTLPPIAVRSSATLASSDGINWQLSTSNLPLSALNAIGVGPTRFLLVSTTESSTSTDGRNWSTRVDASTPGNDVLWDGVRWIGVGSNQVRISP
jgi:hypothetical protein